MTVNHNGINATRDGKAVWEPDAEPATPQTARDAVLAAAPASVSVPPPAPRADDRAAVLREAADAVFALDYDAMVGEEGDENLGSMREAWDLGTVHATKLLLRMADEAAIVPPPAPRAACPRCRHDERTRGVLQMSALELYPPDHADDCPAGLRKRIADELRAHGIFHLGDEVPADEYDCCADAVLAVLPEPVDRADRVAVLAEVADWLKVWRPEFFEMADQAQQPAVSGPCVAGETQPYTCAHCGQPITNPEAWTSRDAGPGLPQLYYHLADSFPECQKAWARGEEPS